MNKKKKKVDPRILRELQSVRLSLQMCQKALTDLGKLQANTSGFLKGPALRDIYRTLRMRRANTAAMELLVHSRNLERELNELERVLRDGEIILNQQAKYYEAASHRIFPAVI